MKKEIHKERLKTATQKQNQKIGETKPNLSYALKLEMEKSASSLLNALPVEKHGLWLIKSEFRDVFCIIYWWDFKNVSSTCACGSLFVLSHALHCLKSGYPIIRQSEIRDLFANLMKKFGHDVEVEPHLQPFNNEPFTSLSNSTCTEYEAGLNISAKGIWGSHFEHSCYYLKIFNPYSSSNRIEDTKGS